MKGSLAVSLGLHAAILAAALVVLPNPKHEVMPVEAITVDISNIADANKLMATAKDAKQPVEAPAPKKAEVVRKTDETLKVADEERKAAKEAKAAVAGVIAAVGATSVKDMGKVMAELKAKFAGQMDMGKAGGIVKALLG